MNTKRNFPWWGVVLGVGCVGILCVGVLGVGGFTYFYLAAPASTEVVSTYSPPSVEQSAPTEAPVMPGPTSFVNPEPTASGLSLTGNQKLTESYLYDDFSSEALDWPVVDDDKIALKYEDGQYSFQIKEPDYFDWAYVPVDFTPLEISFDMTSMAGPQNGTAGVFCQYQDEDNYFYVEFDPGEASYVIGQYVDGEDIVLTPENAVGQYWQEASSFNSAPGAVNRIGISCYQNFITLYVNEEWVTDVNPPQPVDELGDMAFFVNAYPSAAGEGYKVYFDNVEVFQPVQ